MISSYTPDRGWMEHCRGHIRVSRQTLTASQIDEKGRPQQDEAIEDSTQHLRQACKTPVNCAEFYHKISTRGLKYGPTFQNLHRARAAPGLCVGHVRNPKMAEVMPCGYQTRLVIHPALLDACFHPLLISAASEAQKAENLYVPNFIKSFSISTSADEVPPADYICYGTSDLKNGRQLLGTTLKVFGVNQKGEIPYIEMHDMLGSQLPLDGLSIQSSNLELSYKLIWEPLDKAGQNSEKFVTSDGRMNKNDRTAAGFKVVTFTYIFHPGEDLIQSIKKALKSTNWTISFSALEDIIFEKCYYVFLDHTEPVLQKFDTQRLLLVQHLFANAEGILWVTCGCRNQTGNPASSMSAGWTRCLRSEMANVKLVTLDLDTPTMTQYDKIAELLQKILQDVLFKDGHLSMDLEYAEIDGRLLVPRLLLDKDKNEYLARQLCQQDPVSQPFKQRGRNLHLAPSKLGLLESTVFTESNVTSMPLGDKEVEIEIFATGMNFKDIMVSLRQVEYEALGLECSGFVTKVGSEAQAAGFKVGDRVCAIAKACYASFTRATHESTIRIPDHMSFVTAASVPIVYCTAYHAVFEAGRLDKGEAVLIHSAAGGVGQAAIMLAKHAGAQIFATVSSEDKKRLLVEMYEIPREHIFSSREIEFERGILQATGGEGVGLVIGSVSIEMRRRSLNILSPLGRFVEIGKRDLELNAYLEMSNFRKALSFTAVDLEILGRTRPQTIKRTLETIFTALRDFPQAIKPVSPITKFLPSQIETAMRRMQGGKHMGKIVIEVKDDDHILVSRPPNQRENLITHCALGRATAGASSTAC